MIASDFGTNRRLALTFLYLRLLDAAFIEKALILKETEPLEEAGSFWWIKQIHQPGLSWIKQSHQPASNKKGTPHPQIERLPRQISSTPTL